jgi:hypothetical protein
MRLVQSYWPLLAWLVLLALVVTTRVQAWRIYTTIRHQHPQLWENLGRPGIFRATSRLKKALRNPQEAARIDNRLATLVRHQTATVLALGLLIIAFILSTAL